jgi:hypothetical protein
MMFELKVRTCCYIHYVPVFASIQRLSLSPSYSRMMDKIVDRMCQLNSYRLSQNWYLTAPPAIVLVAGGFSRSSRLAR